ncbi:shikimate kinase [Streptomyces sp. WM6378]|uniref:shikimate kinase n=1 Tax=Streptomyces sp. WM6378 TaxID=1415557 RepID=UPI0006AFEE88|nr:shikimate kinase [Streptomyces sp. WM6378]KOU47764.1 hypothetical protein ADK54_12840 [Streptomyces sp. WM6378]
MNGPAVVLVGMPGTGKSVVGQALADHLGLAFRDTDHDLERLTGQPAHELLGSGGEVRFRAWERRAVGVAVREHAGVLALGGGAVLHHATRRQLKECRVVHLWAGLDTLAERVGSAESRPLLTEDPRRRLAQMMQERLPLYRDVATVSVRAEHREPDEIAVEIAVALAALV